jgi:hypothetical protein
MRRMTFEAGSALEDLGCYSENRDRTQKRLRTAT